MDLTTGVNVFISAVIREKGIPFDLYDTEEREYAESFKKSMREAKEDIKKGYVYTHEEVLSELGIS